MQFDLENVVAELVGSSLTEYNVTASEWRLTLSATLTVGSRPGLPSLPRMGLTLGASASFLKSEMTGGSWKKEDLNITIGLVIATKVEKPDDTPAFSLVARSTFGYPCNAASAGITGSVNISLHFAKVDVKDLSGSFTTFCDQEDRSDWEPKYLVTAGLTLLQIGKFSLKDIAFSASAYKPDPEGEYFFTGAFAGVMVIGNSSSGDVSELKADFTFNTSSGEFSVALDLSVSKPPVFLNLTLAAQVGSCDEELGDHLEGSLLVKLPKLEIGATFFGARHCGNHDLAMASAGTKVGYALVLSDVSAIYAVYDCRCCLFVCAQV